MKTKDKLRTFYKVRQNLFNRPNVPEYQVCALVMRKTPSGTWLLEDGDGSLLRSRLRIRDDEMKINLFNLSASPEQAVQWFLTNLQRKVKHAKDDVARAEQALQQFELAMKEGQVHGRDNEADTHAPYRGVQSRGGSEAGAS